MLRIGVKVSGLKDLIATNDRVIKKLDSGDISEKLIKRIVRSAKRYAPRKSGDLVAAIDYKKVGKDKYIITCDATNKYGDPYPIYLEFGTKYILVGSPENPRTIKSSSGKMAQLPFIGSAIWRTTRNLDTIVNQIVKMYE
jgi:hypothetical protein